MARPFPRPLQLIAAGFLFLGSAAVAPARHGVQLTDSLQAVVTGQRAKLAHADSTGDLPGAYAARLRLVPLVRNAEAMVLLRQAALLADSMDRPGLGAMVHSVLAKRLAVTGKHAAAYREALRRDSLERLFGARQIDSLDARYAGEMARLAAARDSAARASKDREARIAQALVEVQRREDQWKLVALATAGTCLLLVLGLLYGMGRSSRKLRASIKTLKDELATVKQAGNRRREMEGKEAAIGSGPVPQPSAPAPPVDEAMDPVVLAMFRKAAPERLASLRRAREQGDHAKALRVVHSLKPQLVSFDEEQFAPLFARLKAEGAARKEQQWSTDLDSLEAAVEALLGNAGH